MLINQKEKISYDLTDNKSDRLVILFAPLGYEDDISFYLDHENDSYLVGVKRKDIAKDLNTFNTLGTIGEYFWWNDDIGDSDYATISLDE